METLKTFVPRPGLALFALAAPLSIAGGYLGAGVALLCFLFWRIADPSSRRWTRTGLEIPWSAWLAWGLLVTALGLAPARGLRQLAGEILIFVFVMAASTDRATARRVLAALLIGGAAAGLLGVAQWALGFSWDVYGKTGALPAWGRGWPPSLVHRLSLWHGRAVGGYSHPITFAETQLLTGFAALGLWVAERRRRWAAVAVVAFGAMVASGTRGVWLGGLGALGLWAVVRRDRRAAAALGVVCLLFGVLSISSPKLRSRAASLLELRRCAVAPKAEARVAPPGAMPLGEADQAGSIRLGLWRAAGRLIRAHPLLGTGVGGFRVSGEDLADHGSPPHLVWTETHNIYLQAAVNRGLPGLALMGWLFAAMLRLFRGAARAAPWANGLLFGFVALLIAGATESWIQDSLVMMHLYLLTGLAAATARGDGTAKLS